MPMPLDVAAWQAEAKRRLEALAEKLGIDLVRRDSPPAEIPQADLGVLDLLEGEHGHGDGDGNGSEEDGEQG